MQIITLYYAIRIIYICIKYRATAHDETFNIIHFRNVRRIRNLRLLYFHNAVRCTTTNNNIILCYAIYIAHARRR